MTTKLEAKISSDFGQMGINDGKCIVDAIRSGETVMRDVLTRVASELHNNEQARVDWLLGYATALKTGGMADGIVKVRKSEANKLFEAMHLQSSKMGQAEAVEYFETLPGTYHNLIEDSRKIIAEALGKDSTRTGKTTSVKKLNSEDVSKLGDRLLASGASVALEVLDKAQTAFIRNAGTPDGIVRQALVYSNELVKSQDKYYHKLGSDLTAMLETALVHGEQQRVDSIKDAQKDLDNKAESKKQATAKAGKPKPATASNNVITALETESKKSDKQLESEIQAIEQTA